MGQTHAKSLDLLFNIFKNPYDGTGATGSNYIIYLRPYKYSLAAIHLSIGGLVLKPCAYPQSYAF